MNSLDLRLFDDDYAAKFTPVDFARALYDATDRDGNLCVPEKFLYPDYGDEEDDETEDDVIYTFQMTWDRDDLERLISEYQSLYAALCEIGQELQDAKYEDMIDDETINDETYVRDALDDSALFDVWYTYLAEPWWSEFSADECATLYNASIMKELAHEEMTAEEARLAERFIARRAEESAKRLGGNHFSDDVHLYAGQLYRSLFIDSDPPKTVIEDDGRHLICFLALWKYAKCE